MHARITHHARHVVATSSRRRVHAAGTLSPIVLGAMLAATSAVPAAAEADLGPFTWNVAPYCNVITVNVTSVGPVYRVEGYDDQCGVGPRASVIGTAFLNPGGTIGIGFNTVTAPGGIPVHIDATVTLPSGNGTWRDSAGRVGALTINPVLPVAGAPRPLVGLSAAALDLSSVQQRVAGTCGAGQAIQSVNQDGTVTCAAGAGGDITGVTAGTGLSGGAASGNAVLNVLFSGSGALDLVARSDHSHRVGASTDANTAIGNFALGAISTGDSNTGLGYNAINDLTTGRLNTAVGARTLDAATTADENTALGASALGLTTTGSGNTAVGFAAAFEQTAGFGNTAVGTNALREKGVGDSNVAIGYDAIRNVASGSANIAIGRAAGEDVTGGSFNIFIGNDGDGVAAQNNTMRIGDVLQTATFIAGINGAAVSGATDSPVLIDANNKLGTTTSSRRFKYDITDLAPDGARLQALRPVSFRYLPDQGRGDSRQFGLIAEEVAETMPELVVLEDGQPFTVRYHQLPPLLLAEVQRLERERAAQATRIESLERELAGLRTLVEARDRR